MGTTRIKVCGITRLEDAVAAIDYGADAIGFIFYAQSPRYLDLESARSLAGRLPIFGLRVGVFVDSGFDEIMEIVKAVSLDTVQLHGAEPPEIAEDLAEEGLRVWKAIRVESLASIKEHEDYPCDAFVLDAFDPKKPGGTGQTFNWDILADWTPDRPWILSGGLTPDNVSEAVHQLNPTGVDVASGVESAPGIKDHALLKSFISHVRPELATV